MLFNEEYVQLLKEKYPLFSQSLLNLIQRAEDELLKH